MGETVGVHDKHTSQYLRALQLLTNERANGYGMRPCSLDLRRALRHLIVHQWDHHRVNDGVNENENARVLDRYTQDQNIFVPQQPQRNLCDHRRRRPSPRPLLLNNVRFHSVG